MSSQTGADIHWRLTERSAWRGVGAMSSEEEGEEEEEEEYRNVILIYFIFRY